MALRVPTHVEDLEMCVLLKSGRKKEITSPTLCFSALFCLPLPSQWQIAILLLLEEGEGRQVIGAPVDWPEVW